MSTIEGRTQTQDHEAGEREQPRLATRFIRFMRADDPFDEVASFALSRRPSWQLGRVDRRPSSSSLQGRIWTYADVVMSSRHAELSETAAGWQISDDASKNGTFVNWQRISEPQLLRHGDIVECGRSFFLFRRTVNDSARVHVPRGTLLELPPFHYQIAPLCAHVSSDVGVHLQGETGTGKEVVARALHTLSERSGRFVAINCAAIPESLFESEMFGHRKGAFSGAVHGQRGAILAADGGTLFLDEIGELSLPMQAKLLRVLELKEVLAVGADAPTPVDFRLVSATLCDLKQMVAEGRFRRDLYARLGHIFVVPPLREHKEELGHLVQFCLASILMDLRDNAELQLKIHFTLEAARALVRYDWPCNIRELKQCIDRAVRSAMAEGSAEGGVCTVDIRHLPVAVAAARGDSSLPEPREPNVEARGAAREQDAESRVHTPASFDPAQAREEGPSDLEIIEALREAAGNRSQAAKLLGVCERTIYRRLKKLRGDNPL